MTEVDTIVALFFIFSGPAAMAGIVLGLYLADPIWKG